MSPKEKEPPCPFLSGCSPWMRVEEEAHWASWEGVVTCPQHVNRARLSFQDEPISLERPPK